MADQNTDWSSDSNNAVNISLVTPGAGGPKTLHTFNPRFTYSIFGDEETIFGYQGLNINLRYNASDMRPGLQITYNKKFKTVGETSAADLKATLEPYLPKNAFEKAAVFDSAISDTSNADWRPPGELIKTIEEADKTYEIWKGSLADPAVQQMVKRIQILVSFFIEGGTPIDLQDSEGSLDRWSVFFFYQKRTAEEGLSPYVFMGYSTVYRYFYYQTKLLSSSKTKSPISRPADLEFTLPFPEADSLTLDFPCRTRISQFIILPPFHGTGSGSRLYNNIYDHYLHEAQTLEITVEDPNEAFDDLRDLNDLSHLRSLPEFKAIKINTSVNIRPKGPVPRDLIDTDALEGLRLQTKIAPRQFYRVVEMQLLSLIPTNIRQSLIEQPPSKKRNPEKEKEYRLWLLWVKKRLYKHNKDTLIQLDRVERIEKLEEVVGGVEADYARLLRAAEGRGKGKTMSNGSGEASGSGGAKRSSPDDEDEEEEHDQHTAKKVKFAAEVEDM